MKQKALEKNRECVRFLATLNKEKEPSTLVRDLITTQKDTHLLPLLTNQFSLDSDASKGDDFSVQVVGIGFMLFFVEKTEISQQYKRKFFDVVFEETEFVPTILGHLTRCSGGPDLWSFEQSSKTLPEAFLVMCKFLLVLVQTLDRAGSSDQFGEWVPKCVKCIRKLKTAFPMEELEDACDLVDSFQDMVDEVEKREIEMLLKKREAKVEQGRAQLLSVQHGVSIPVEITPGPGSLFSEAGPRHDNDKESYRDIAVLPTKQEIETTLKENHEPYLPRLNDPQPYCLNDTDRLLDRNFRLLRYELLYPLSLTISSLTEHFSHLQHFKPSPSSSSSSSSSPPISKESHSFLVSLTQRLPFLRDICVKGRGEDQTSITVLYNVSFHTFRLDLRKGVVASFSFDLPTPAKKNPNAWLEGKGKRFLSNTQIGLFYDLPTRSYCLVVPDDDPTIQKEGNQQRICMNFTVPPSESNAFCTLIRNTSETANPPSKIPSRFIFFIPSIFFPMILPILKGLQAHNVFSLPFGGSLSLPNFQIDSNTPKYLRSKHLSLAPILTDEAQSRTLNIADPKQMVGYLSNNRHLTKLDEGQLSAFFACLLQEIAVIQGPPGTGKSYLGVQVLKTLIKATSHPILVICFTNHALDQFLGDLIEGGVVKTNEITRLGGQSKDPRLHDASWSQKIKLSNKKENRAKKMVFNLRQEAEMIESEMSDWSSLRSFRIPFSRFQSLAEEYGDFLGPCQPLLEFIFEKEDEEGYERKDTPQKIYTKLVKKLGAYAKKRDRTFAKMEEGASNETPAFPPGRPCPHFLFGGECSDPPSCGSHNTAWMAHAKVICRSWLETGECRTEKAKRGGRGRGRGKGRGAEIKKCPNSASHLQILCPQVLFPLDLGKPCPFFICKDECNKARCSLSHDQGWKKFSSQLCFHYLVHSGHCNSGLKCSKSRGHRPELLQLRNGQEVEEEKEEPKREERRKLGTELYVPLEEATKITNQAIQKYYPKWKGGSDEAFSAASSSPGSWRTFDEFDTGQQLALYLMFCEIVLPRFLDRFARLMEDYYDVASEYKEAHLEDNTRLLATSKVIGVTTSGAAKNSQLLTSAKAKVMIVEEAGEVLESHLLTSLSVGIEHLILIGDHQQLRPKINTFRLKGESGQGYDLDCSMFERLVKGDFPKSTLRVQYRMFPTISNLIRPFYASIKGGIKDSDTVSKYPEVSGMKERLFFFDHSKVEDGGNGEGGDTSKSNTWEAKMAVGLALYLMNSGYAGHKLALITPYVGQLLKLRSILEKKQVKIILNDLDEEEVAKFDEPKEVPSSPSPGVKKLVGSALKHLRLATIDNFQGEEADVVIVSTVRCNSNGRIGFLRFDNRVNVMFSRAKHGMYVFGSKATVEKYEKNQQRYNHPPCLFSGIVGSFEKAKLIDSKLGCRCDPHKTLTFIHKPDDWEKVNEGGCEKECRAKLDCGHTCPRQCHSNDRRHLDYDCRMDCMKLCAKGKHPCVGRCSQKCPPCQKSVEVTLSCGHQRKALCSDNIEKLNCTATVDVVLPWCGHTLKKIVCFKAQEIKKNPSKVLPICRETCSIELPECHHKCRATCGECTQLNAKKNKGSIQITKTVHKPCSQPCERPLECTHTCKKLCHKQGECPQCDQPCAIGCSHSRCGEICSRPCFPCMQDCDWDCEHQGRCPTTCGLPCLRLPCDHRCEKLLVCGHRCPSVCGEICPKKMYCLECGSKKESEVEFIEFLPYGELDVNTNPVCVLPCGHFYAISHLDSQLKMEEMYTKGEDGEWVGLKQFQDFDGTVLVCPKCNAGISGVKRYGRYAKGVSLLLQRKRHYQHFLSLSVLYQKNSERVLGQSSPGNLNKMRNFFQQPAISQKEKEVFDLFQKSNDAARVSCLRAQDKNQRMFEGWEEGIFVPSPVAEVFFLVGVVQKKEVLYKLRAGVLLFLDVVKRGKEELSNVESQKWLEFIERFFSSSKEVESSTTSSSSSSSLEKKEEESRLQRCKGLLSTRLLQFIDHDLPDFILKAKNEWNFSTKLTGVMDDIAHILLQIFGDFGKGKLSHAERSGFRPCFSSFDNWVNNDKVLSEKARANTKKGLELLKNNFSSEFYDTVSDEEFRKVLQAGAHDWGSHHGSFGSRFRECPNGHVYVIGECGGAVVEAKCPECGALIGGQGHRHAEGTKEAQRAQRLGIGRG